MSLDKNFCSSPWIHTRINNTGHYEYCRWANKHYRRDQPHISQRSPVEWFQQDMAPIRKAMIDAIDVPGCQECRVMEQHGKVSGRQKQLLKTGVLLDSFVKTMRSSPWLSEWQASMHDQGLTSQYPQDWQIDLGNFCNSACLFCTPDSSSRIAAERLKLGMITDMPPKSWCDDPLLLDRFIDALVQSPHLRYLHFLGGETLITPGFRKILQRLIDHGLSKDLTIGFTTNLTVMDVSIVDLLLQFGQINLGMSIECLDRVNDYVRYGGKIAQTMEILTQWIELATKLDWLIQLRTTPTVLSISRLTDVYEYAWVNNLVVESCNFIQDPEFMRPTVLPMPERNRVGAKLRAWIHSKNPQQYHTPVINIRDPNRVHQQLLEDAQSYLHYLEHQPDLSHLLPDLVRYLKRMDHNRNVCVLDYLPEYEDLFRSAGY